MVDKAAPPGIRISYRLYLDGGEAGAEQQQCAQADDQSAHVFAVLA